MRRKRGSCAGALREKAAVQLSRGDRKETKAALKRLLDAYPEYAWAARAALNPQDAAAVQEAKRRAVGSGRNDYDLALALAAFARGDGEAAKKHLAECLEQTLDAAKLEYPAELARELLKDLAEE